MFVSALVFIHIQDQICCRSPDICSEMGSGCGWYLPAHWQQHVVPQKAWTNKRIWSSLAKVIVQALATAAIKVIKTEEPPQEQSFWWHFHSNRFPTSKVHNHLDFATVPPESFVTKVARGCFGEAMSEILPVYTVHKRPDFRWKDQTFQAIAIGLFVPAFSWVLTTSTSSSLLSPVTRKWSLLLNAFSGIWRAVLAYYNYIINII